MDSCRVILDAGRRWPRLSEQVPAEVKWIPAGLFWMRGVAILMRRREGVARPELHQNRRDGYAAAAIGCEAQ